MLGQLPLENSGWRVGVGELGLESWGWRPGFRELGLESWVWMVGASQSFHRGLRAGWGAPPLPPPNRPGGRNRPWGRKARSYEALITHALFLDRLKCKREIVIKVRRPKT